MLRSITRSVAVTMLAFALGGGVSAIAGAQGANSGFLSDYSELTTEKDPLGMDRRTWVSALLIGDRYQKFLIEPVIFYPEPQPSDRVPADSLKDLREYLDGVLRQVVRSVLPLADQPGPGVARVRVAVTAVAVGSGLKPYQLIPVALVSTAASGQSGRDARLAVEAEITDSVTGKPLARSVRQAKGVEVKGDAGLTLQQAKPQIDDWAEAVRQTLAARMKPIGVR